MCSLFASIPARSALTDGKEHCTCSYWGSNWSDYDTKSGSRGLGGTYPHISDNQGHFKIFLGRPNCVHRSFRCWKLRFRLPIFKLFLGRIPIPQWPCPTVNAGGFAPLQAMIIKSIKEGTTYYSPQPSSIDSQALGIALLGFTFSSSFWGGSSDPNGRASTLYFGGCTPKL